MRMKEKRSWIGFLACIVLTLSTIFSNGIQVMGLNTSEYDTSESDAQTEVDPEKKVEGNKTVQLLDWDERTYQVKLDASSLMTEEEEKTSVDVILVLDNSGGMNSNLSQEDGKRRDVIKGFAKELITNLGESKESRVGVVTFNHDTDKHDLTELDQEGKGSLEKFIVEKLNDSKSNAQPSMGLKVALDMLDKNKKSHVIFVTSENNKNEEAEKSLVIADEIKKYAKIHTVALVTGKGQEESYIKDISSGDGYAYNVWNSDELSKALKGIWESIQVDIPVKGAVIKEYIDPRFEVVGRPDGAEIGVDESGQYLLWKTDIPNYDEEENRPGWETDFILKAKECYIGGNDVPTSDESSGIYFNDNKEHSFKNLTVNVKINDFRLGQVEQEVFLGETLDYYFTDGVERSVSSLYSLAGVEYDSNMFDDIFLTRAWYSDEDCKNEITPSDIRSSSPKNSTTYYVKFIVCPKEMGVKSAASSIGDKNGNSETDGYRYYANSDQGISAIGTYAVNLVSGSIEVVKTISVKDINFNRGNPIFTLRITDEKNISRYQTVEFKKEELEAITDKDQDQYASLSVEFKGLPKGNYSVGEEHTIRYQSCDSYVLESVGEYPCEISDTTFCIGSNINSRDGKATIKNENVMDAYSSDTDVVTNHFSMEDGKIKVEQWRKA